MAGRGLLGAGGLGVPFGLSFCSISAGLFFGGSIPLAMSANSRVVLPSVSGVGTGPPVVVFAVLIALGAQGVAKTFHALAGFERAARVATGVIFLGAATYLILTHLLSVGV